MSNNDPSNFSFRLQKGITNSSNPSRIIELNYIPSDSSSLDSNSNSSGPSYQFKSNDLTSTSSSSSGPKTLDVDSVSKFDLSKILEKLKDLPVEDPVGSEDIYGLDTQIYYFSPSFEWVNGGPGGCIASEDSTSKVHPTKEQKETFKQIVEKIEEMSNKV